MTKRYGSVRDMVYDLCDAESAKAFDDYQSKRRLVNYLVVNRGIVGIPEDEMAERINVPLEVLQRMESGTDAELPFLTTLSYLDALGDTRVSAINRWLSR